MCGCCAGYRCDREAGRLPLRSGDLCSEGREVPFYLATYHGIMFYSTVGIQRMRMAQTGVAANSSKCRQQGLGFGRLCEIMSTVWTSSSES